MELLGKKLYITRQMAEVLDNTLKDTIRMKKTLLYIMNICGCFEYWLKTSANTLVTSNSTNRIYQEDQNVA